MTTRHDKMLEMVDQAVGIISDNLYTKDDAVQGWELTVLLWAIANGVVRLGRRCAWVDDEYFELFMNTCVLEMFSNHTVIYNRNDPYPFKTVDEEFIAYHAVSLFVFGATGRQNVDVCLGDGDVIVFKDDP